MRLHKWTQAAGLALACWALPGLATASTISQAGLFLTDDQTLQFQFSLATASTVTIQSFAYGGGVNGLGATIPQGGFATDIALFAATGMQNLLDEDSYGGTAPSSCGPRHIDSHTGLCLDAYLQVANLAAGSYIFTLTEQGNPANGPTLGDGFAEMGMGNFTGGPFIDPFGNQRNGNFAVDLSAAGLVVSSVPEPSTAALTLLFISAIAIAARRRPLAGISFKSLEPRN